MAPTSTGSTITGNLTRDPELRALPSGTAVCELGVAVNTRRKDQGDQWVEEPNYFDVTVFGAQGQNCAQYLSKGRPVAIDGRLVELLGGQERGGKRQSVDIVAETVQFLGTRGDNGGAAAVRRRPGVRGELRRPGRHLRLRRPAGRRRAGGGGADDDIPF